MAKMNILIASAGTRNKVVQYFKREFKDLGKVIATDASELAPAIYDADKYYIVPKIDDPNYINNLLDICKKENIDCILSLIDPELSLIAKNRDKFEAIGVTPLVSSYEATELAFDKYEMFKYLDKRGYKAAKTYVDKEEFYKDLEKGAISFPVFIKPVKGSASINISKVTTKDEVELLFNLYSLSFLSCYIQIRIIRTHFLHHNNHFQYHHFHNYYHIHTLYPQMMNYPNQ